MSVARRTAALLRTRWAVPALVAVAVGVTILLQIVQARTLWLDEEMVALNIRDRSFADLAGPLWLGQSAPYGWLVLERVTIALFGVNDISVRAIPALFGLGTIALAFWVGRRWLGVVGTTVFVAMAGLSTWVALYAVEVKPYSADVFWALVLPALAARLVQTARPDGPPWRSLVWFWSAAAVGQWFGNGATLVLPVCVSVLAIALMRRFGWMGLIALAAPGAIFLGAFATHYLLSIRHTFESTYLEAYWMFAFPREGSPTLELLRWIGRQFAPFAAKPGGSDLWLQFWLAGTIGILVVMRRNLVLGIICFLIPIFAITLAVLRTVPLYERLSLWVVPALLIGVSAAADESIRLLRRAGPPASRAATVMLAIAVGVVAWNVVREMLTSGAVDVATRLERNASNHSLDDRAAVEWIRARIRPGDVVLTTKLGLPALWWYGDASIAEPNVGRSIGGATILEVAFSPRTVCASNLVSAIGAAPRALVHLGFRFDDVPKGFDGLLFDELVRMGEVSEYREFGDDSRVAVVTLQRLDVRRPVRQSFDQGVPLPDYGCLDVKPAVRW